MFIPIKNDNNQYIKNLYIIKIIIHQGDTDQLYSTIERGGYISFIRLSGQCINLSAQEIRDDFAKLSIIKKIMTKVKQEIHSINTPDSESEEEK